MNSFNPSELFASHPLYKGGYHHLAFSKDSTFRDFINKHKIDNNNIPNNIPLPPHLDMHDGRRYNVVHVAPDNNLRAVNLDEVQTPDDNANNINDINDSSDESPDVSPRQSPVRNRPVQNRPVQNRPVQNRPVVMPAILQKLDQNTKDTIKDSLCCMLSLVDADDVTNDHLPDTQGFFEHRNKQTKNEDMARFWYLIKNLSEFYQKNGTLPIGFLKLSARDVGILCNYFDVCWSLLAYKSEIYGFLGTDLKAQKIAIGNIILAGEQAFYDCYSNGKKIFTADYEFEEDEIMEEDTYDYTRRAKRVDDALLDNKNIALGFFKALDSYFDQADL